MNQNRIDNGNPQPVVPNFNANIQPAKIKPAKADIKSETNAVALENFSERGRQIEPHSSPLLKRVWKEIKSFFSKAAFIYDFFAGLANCFPKQNKSDVQVPVESVINNFKHQEQPIDEVKLDEKKDDFLDHPYRENVEGTSDDGLVYTKEGLIYSANGANTLPYVEEVEYDGKPLVNMDAVPAGIPNSQNACYRIASVQALLACDSIVKMIQEPWLIDLSIPYKDLEGDAKEERERYWIKNKLNELIQHMQNNDSQEIIQMAEESMALSVFGYGLHSEFVKGDEGKQLDALAFLGLILGDLFNIIRVEHHVNYIEVGKGRFESRDMGNEIFKSPAGIHLKPGVTNLQDLVNQKYLPKEIDSNIKGLESYRIISQPEGVLPLHLNRAITDRKTGITSVIQDDIEMPEDGILDFSVAHGWVEGTLQYRIKSFIQLHAETSDAGHYTAYAIRNGKWYHFNDNDVEEVSEAKAMKEMGRAYILMLERL